MKENIELRLKLASFFESIGWSLEAFALRRCGTDKKNLLQLLRILDVNIAYARDKLGPESSEHKMMLTEFHDVIKVAQEKVTSMHYETSGEIPDSIVTPVRRDYPRDSAGLSRDIKKAIKEWSGSTSADMLTKKITGGPSWGAKYGVTQLVAPNVLAEKDITYKDVLVKDTMLDRGVFGDKV